MKIMIVVAAFLVFALSVVVPAGADTINATIPGADFSVPGRIGTFNYSVPDGSVILEVGLSSPLYSFPAANQTFFPCFEFPAVPSGLCGGFTPGETQFFLGSILPPSAFPLTGSLELQAQCLVGPCPTHYTRIGDAANWTLDIQFQPPVAVCGDGIVAGNEQCDDGNTTSADGCSATCEVEPGYQCDGEPSTCSPVCANPAFGEEARSFCSILNDGGKVHVTGPAGEIQGNICMGQGGKVSMSGSNFATDPGQVILEPGASCAGCTAVRVPGGVTNDDLTPEIDACAAARAANTPPAFGGTGRACTATVATLQDLVVRGVIAPGVSPGIIAGKNVVCITKQQEVKKDIRLSGGATTKYVFVVKGKFKYNQAKVVTDCAPPQADPAACTAAGVGPDDVLWLFVGSGQELRSSGGGGGGDCCKAELDGSVIIDGKIALSPGLINGQVCGTGDWAFVGGSGVHCPAPGPYPYYGAGLFGPVKPTYALASLALVGALMISQVGRRRRHPRA
jgi:cysteine-rich repeat protein